MSLPMPAFLQRFYAMFPLHIYEQEPTLPASLFSSPASPDPSEAEGYQVEDIATNATLFIHPPAKPEETLLSSDIECVKWQAYLALRAIPGGVKVRWDLASEGAVDGRLPNLFLPVPKRLARKDMKGELLESRRIPSWVDGEIGKATGGDEGDEALEGYKDDAARDESRAWVALLEGDIHAALKATTPLPSILTRITSFQTSSILEKPILSKTFTGVSSMVPPFGSTVVLEPLVGRYKDAIEALSERLTTDRWFLGSRFVSYIEPISNILTFSIAEIQRPWTRWHLHTYLPLWQVRMQKFARRFTNGSTWWLGRNACVRW